MPTREAPQGALMTRLMDVATGKSTRAENGDTILPIAIASGHPVTRWYGTEVLSMQPDAIRLGRLNDGANVLFNHDPDKILGSHMSGSARVAADGVLRADVRLSPVTQQARDAIAMHDAGHLTKVSVGYSIHRVVERAKKKGRDGADEIVTRELDGVLFERMVRSFSGDGSAAAFRRALDAAVGGDFKRSADDEYTYDITDWEPFESSLVTTPADPTVGVGRAIETAEVPAAAVRDVAIPTAKPAATPERIAMSDVTTAAAGAGAEPQANTRNVNAMELESARKQAIKNAAKVANINDERVVSHWMQSGASIESVGEDILKIYEARGADRPQDGAGFIGMEKDDLKNWSLFRAIRALESGDWSKAGLELATSRAVQEKYQKAPSGKSVFVPTDVLRRPLSGQRDINVATANQGGYLVDTQNQGFIDILRNTSVAFNMGARRLAGLQGNVTIPKQSAAATGYWLTAETTQITESTPTFGQVSLTPKTVGAYNEISRLALLQTSPDVEQLSMADLAKVVGLSVDSAVLNGSGSAGQPLGIVGTSGIGGFTGTSLGYAALIDAQADVATANALSGSIGYVTTPAVAALLMARQRFSSTDTPLWDGNILNATVGGFKAMSSNQMPTADMIFGDWSQVIVGEWGVLEIAINPQANFQAGIIGVRAMYTIDVAVRIAAAFSLATSIT